MATTGSDNERQMLGIFLVPGVYLRVMGETVRRLGHDDRPLYQGLAFGAEDLKADDSRVFVTDAMIMAQRAGPSPAPRASVSPWPGSCG